MSKGWKMASADEWKRLVKNLVALDIIRSILVSVLGDNGENKKASLLFKIWQTPLKYKVD